MLALQYHGMRASDAIALAEGLEYNDTISVVNLTGNSITEASHALGHALQVIV